MNTKTVISSTFEDCVSIANGSFIYLGYDKSYRFEYVRNVYGEEITGIPSKYTIYEPDGKKKDINFFRKLMPFAADNRVREAPYVTSLYKHPLKNIVLMAFEYSD